MEKKEFEFFVTSQEKRQTENGTTYRLRLKSGDGHTLTFKAEDENLFAGFPIGQAVSVKLGNPQTTLPSPSESAKKK